MLEIYTIIILLGLILVTNLVRLYFTVKNRTATAVNNLHYEVTQQVGNLKETQSLMLNEREP
jgi:hypothetical protein